MVSTLDSVQASSRLNRTSYELRAPHFPPVASVASLSRLSFVFTLFCASSFRSLAAMTLVVVVMSSEELSFQELTGAAIINVVASRSWHLLRRSLKPPAVSTTYDLGSAHLSLTVPLNHVFDGLSMMQIYVQFNCMTWSS